MRRYICRRSAQALDASDGEALRRAAHGLKGAAANFDASAVVSAARELEEIGRSRSVRHRRGALATLSSETDRLVVILRSVCA